MSNIPNRFTVVNEPKIMDSEVALEENVSRMGWSVQNLSVYPLYIRKGKGASPKEFHVVLAGGKEFDDGNGGLFSQLGAEMIFTGMITVAGDKLRYVVTEI